MKKTKQNPSVSKSKKVFTIKQQKLLQEVANPENKTMREAALKAGFTSNDIYRDRIRTHIKDHFDAKNPTIEMIRARFEELYSKCLESQDISTAKGCMDSLAKTIGAFKDVSEVHTTIKDDSEVSELQSLRDERSKHMDGSISDTQS
jgi:hypothetical protein